mmetsp:Transcript_32623/g.78408  ORF Transcript_32623/g.78408 Transcript_32623/m.78408 type:complete len:506 (-) Transcript_32623:322-1839(-)
MASDAESVDSVDIDTHGGLRSLCFGPTQDIERKAAACQPQDAAVLRRMLAYLKERTQQAVRRHNVAQAATDEVDADSLQVKGWLDAAHVQTLEMESQEAARRSQQEFRSGPTATLGVQTDSPGPITLLNSWLEGIVTMGGTILNDDAADPLLLKLVQQRNDGERRIVECGEQVQAANEHRKKLEGSRDSEKLRVFGLQRDVGELNRMLSDARAHEASAGAQRDQSERDKEAALQREKETEVAYDQAVRRIQDLKPTLAAAQEAEVLILRQQESLEEQIVQAYVASKEATKASDAARQQLRLMVQKHEKTESDIKTKIRSLQEQQELTTDELKRQIAVVESQISAYKRRIAELRDQIKVTQKCRGQLDLDAVLSTARRRYNDAYRGKKGCKVASLPPVSSRRGDGMLQDKLFARALRDQRPVKKQMPDLPPVLAQSASTPVIKQLKGKGVPDVVPPSLPAAPIPTSQSVPYLPPSEPHKFRGDPAGSGRASPNRADVRSPVHVWKS